MNPTEMEIDNQHIVCGCGCMRSSHVKNLILFDSKDVVENFAKTPNVYKLNPRQHVQFVGGLVALVMNVCVYIYLFV